MEKAADQYLDHDKDAEGPSIPASVIPIPRIVTDLQAASEPQEEATPPEPETGCPPVIAIS